MGCPQKVVWALVLGMGWGAAGGGAQANERGAKPWRGLGTAAAFVLGGGVLLNSCGFVSVKPLDKTPSPTACPSPTSQGSHVQQSNQDPWGPYWKWVLGGGLGLAASVFLRFAYLPSGVAESRIYSPGSGEAPPTPLAPPLGENTQSISTRLVVYEVHFHPNHDSYSIEGFFVAPQVLWRRYKKTSGGATVMDPPGQDLQLFFQAYGHRLKKGEGRYFGVALYLQEVFDDRSQCESQFSPMGLKEAAQASRLWDDGGGTGGLTAFLDAQEQLLFHGKALGLLKWNCQGPLKTP